MSTSTLLYRNECWLSSANGTYDKYGNERIGPERKATCAIVKFAVRSEKSTVRADSSGSRGAAQETIVDAVLLFKPFFKIDLDDCVRIGTTRMRVVSVTPRYLITGGVDHNQVECVVWV
jgi:hypothetical protein